MNSSKKRFLEVLDKHHGIIKSLCKVYYTQVDDQRDAEQDIILQLWKSFDTFRGDAQVSTWIYKVGLNTLLSKNKKEQKRPKQESITPTHESISTSFHDDDLALLKQLIQSLKKVDKALVILYLEGYSTKEIAEMMQLTQSNVTTRMSRIKKEWKSKVKTYSYELR